MKTNTIPEELYNALPTSLKNACMHFSKPQERDVFLLAALTIIGNNFNKYAGIYNGQYIYPTLQLFTVYRQPLQALQAAMLLAYKLDEEYIKDYEFDVRDRKEEGIEEPAINRQRLMPAHTTYMHLVKTLSLKKGLGLLHCTLGEDMPTIATEADKTALLYKSYYNQSINHHTVTNGQNIYIEQLQLSALLGGSYQKLQQVIPNKQCCLYPNFLYYITEDSSTHYNPFEQTETIDSIIAPFAEHIMDITGEFTFLDEVIPFILNETQQEQFIYHTEGYTLQQSMTCYRIAMIITVLELMKEGRALQVKEIPCYDEALNIAFGISDVLNSHYRAVDNYLEEHGIDIVLPTTTQQHTEEEVLAASLHEQGLSLRKIAVELYNDEGKFMKVKRMLTRMGIAA